MSSSTETNKQKEVAEVSDGINVGFSERLNNRQQPFHPEAGTCSTNYRSVLLGEI